MDGLGRWIALLLLTWLILGSPAYAATTPALERAYDSFMDVHERTRGWSTADRESEIARAFDTRFDEYFKDDVGSLSEEDAALLFSAANIAHAYSIRTVYLEKMVSAFERLQTQTAVSERIYSDMYGALVASRRFDQAAQLATRFPQWQVEALPKLDGDAQPGPVVLTVKSSTHVEKASLNIEHGPRIVVISHPLCHFSQRAVAAIEQDPALSKALAGSVWLAPVDRKLYLDVLLQWNQAHPAHQVVIALDRIHWPALKSWSTPTFYFLNDGQIVARVEGWPAQGQREQVLRAAKQIGL